MLADLRAAPGLSRVSRLIGYAFAAALVCALAGCGGSGGASYRGGGGYAGSGDYAPPGSPDDPWGPYIREASDRFGVPQKWIREVMRQESGGHEYLNGRLTTSAAGAMGLMQLMPGTYEGLRQRYALGPDPYDPHENIMAGTAYIREMYDQFGYPEFLAAYNAGPGRVADYLAGGGSLPRETRNYVASIAPRIADIPGPSGPVPTYYAQNSPSVPVPQSTTVPMARVTTVAMVSPTQAGCDPDAAYNPERPCQAPAPLVVATPSVIAMAPIVDVADQPGYQPPTPEPVQMAALSRLSPPPMLLPVPPAPPMRLPVPPRPAPRFQLASLNVNEAAFAGRGGWSVQVGAFETQAKARAVAEAAQFAAADLLRGSRIEVPVKPMVGGVLYRARLSGISAARAVRVCQRLEARRFACVPVGASQVW